MTDEEKQAIRRRERLEIATAVLQAWCHKCPDYKSFVQWECAEDCFYIADAMLAELEKEPP